MSQNLIVAPEKYSFEFSPMGFFVDCDRSRGVQVYNVSEATGWSKLAWIENMTNAVAVQTKDGLKVMGSKLKDCKLGVENNVAAVWRVENGVIDEEFTAEFGPSVIGKPTTREGALQDLYFIGNTIELDISDARVPAGYRPTFSPYDSKAGVRSRQSLSSFHTVSVLWGSNLEESQGIKVLAFINSGADIFLDTAVATDEFIYLAGENGAKPMLVSIPSPQ